MKQLVIDPQMGMAGDMLCSALLSLGVPQKEMLLIMEEAAETIGGAVVTAKKQTHQGLKGIILEVKCEKLPPSTKSSLIEKALIRICQRKKLARSYREFAHRSLKILIQAESQAHKQIAKEHTQINQAHSHLHEAQDIIIDIAGSAWGLAALSLPLHNVICLAPLRTGSGTIVFSHGRFNVPAPATRVIINKYNIPTEPGPVARELFTPTGAALLAALSPTYMDRKKWPSLKKDIPCGVGFGTKKYKVHGHIKNGLILYARDY